MNYRGKGIRWTESEDQKVLAGLSPAGRTPAQVRNRRSNLKLNFERVVVVICRKLIDRLEYMSRIGLLNTVEKKFLKEFANSIKKLL